MNFDLNIADTERRIVYSDLTLTSLLNFNMRYYRVVTDVLFADGEFVRLG